MLICQVLSLGLENVNLTTTAVSVRMRRFFYRYGLIGEHLTDSQFSTDYRVGGIVSLELLINLFLRHFDGHVEYRAFEAVNLYAPASVG